MRVAGEWCVLFGNRESKREINFKKLEIQSMHESSAWSRMSLTSMFDTCSDDLHRYRYPAYVLSEYISRTTGPWLLVGIERATLKASVLHLFDGDIGRSCPGISPDWS